MFKSGEIIFKSSEVLSKSAGTLYMIQTIMDIEVAISNKICRVQDNLPEVSITISDSLVTACRSSDKIPRILQMIRSDEDIPRLVQDAISALSVPCTQITQILNHEIEGSTDTTIGLRRRSTMP